MVGSTGIRILGHVRERRGVGVVGGESFRRVTLASMVKMEITTNDKMTNLTTDLTSAFVIGKRR